MDDLNQRNEIDNALRELAKLRDGALRTAPVLSPERRAVLVRSVLEQFPVEVGLREAATKKDQVLNLHPPRIPVSVESGLRRQLQLAEAARGEGWPVSGWRWMRIFRSPLGVGLTACGLITVAIACFGKWGASPRRIGTESLPLASGVNLNSALTLDRPSISQAELFSRRITIASFSLHTSEPGSLEASFVSSRRIQFADGVETPLGLRLDLPVRATLMEEGLARMP